MSMGGQLSSSVVVACSALAAASASAAEWRITPSSSVAADYSDNPRLLTSGGEAANGVRSELSTQLLMRTERVALSMIPRIVSSHYSNDATLSSTDEFIDFAGQWQSERTTWATTANFTRDTTLTSEIGFTGLIQSNRRHEGITLGGGPTVQVTERLSLGGQLYEMRNHYVDARYTGLVDYDYSLAGLNAGWVVSERTTLTVDASAGELRAPDAGMKTRNESLKLGMNYTVSELWMAKLSAGPAWVQADAGEDTGWVLSSEFHRHTERNDWSVTLARELTPAGQGLLTRRDSLSIGFIHQITEHTAAEVYVHAINNQTLSPGLAVNYDTVHYQQVETRFRWMLSPSWSLVASASAQRQSFSTYPDAAAGSRALLNIVWNGQPKLL